MAQSGNMTPNDRRMMNVIDAGIRSKNLKFKLLWGRIAVKLGERHGEETEQA